mgnify:FL=1
MNKFFFKISPVLTTLALFVVALNVNTTCALYAYQPSVPKAVQNIKKKKKDLTLV